MFLNEGTTWTSVRSWGSLFVLWSWWESIYRERNVRNAIYAKGSSVIIAYNLFHRLSENMNLLFHSCHLLQAQEKTVPCTQSTRSSKREKKKFSLNEIVFLVCAKIKVIHMKNLLSIILSEIPQYRILSN